MGIYSKGEFTDDAGFDVEIKDDYKNVIKDDIDFNKRRKAVIEGKTKVKVATAQTSRSQLI